MLVQVSELRSYMGGFQPKDGQATELMHILAGVQQDLENYLNRPVEYIQLREFVLSDRQGYLYLSVTPVRKIIACGVATAPDIKVEPTDVKIPYVTSRDALLNEEARVIDKVPFNFNNFRLDYGRLWVGKTNTWHVVEYIGGLNGYTNDAVKLAIKRVAARYVRKGFVDNAGLSQGQIDQVEVGDNLPIGWQKEELDRFSRLKRRIFL